MNDLRLRAHAGEEKQRRRKDCWCLLPLSDSQFVGLFGNVETVPTLLSLVGKGRGWFMGLPRYHLTALGCRWLFVYSCIVNDENRGKEKKNGGVREMDGGVARRSRPAYSALYQ